MKTNALTARNWSLFEIDTELEAAFDQIQEERLITCNIGHEVRDRCMQLFAAAAGRNRQRSKLERRGHIRID